MSGNVLVFARAPVLGAVKTRLEPAVGPARTLELYRAFLADALTAARESGARVMLSHTSGSFDEQKLADDAFAQRGDSFGARFDHALEDARARCEGPLVLIGADTPHLGPALLRGALDALSANAAVLGPSTEGGFYLLGFRGDITPVAKAFDEPNEAAAVARLTSPRLLASSFDVDVPEDLANLILHLETLRAARAWVPERTAAALARMGVRVQESSTMGARRRRIVIA